MKTLLRWKSVRNGRKKVLWSLSGNAKRERLGGEDKALKTGSRYNNRFPTIKTPGNRFS